METLSIMLLSIFVSIIIITVLFVMYLYYELKHKNNFKDNENYKEITEEFLILYVKEMQRSYKLSLYFPFLKYWLCTDYGFCKYITNDWIYEASENMYKKDILKFIVKYSNFEVPNSIFEVLGGNFWFKAGAIKPRLELLNKTIKNYYETKALERQKIEDLEENY